MKQLAIAFTYSLYAIPVLTLCWFIWNDFSQVEQLKKARSEIVQLQTELAHIRGQH